MPWWTHPVRSFRAIRAANDSLREQLQRLTAEKITREFEMQDLVRAKAAALQDNMRLNRDLIQLRGQMAAAVTDARVSGAALSTAEPEFVLVGIPRPDGSKRLMASRELDVTAFAMTEPDKPPPRWKLGAILGQLLVIDKPGYSEALAHLMTIWGNQDRAAIEAKRALDMRQHMLPGQVLNDPQGLRGLPSP